MKTILHNLRQRHWDTRPSGERRGILIGAAFILPVLGYLLLWSPSHEAVNKLRTTLPQLQLQADLVRHTAALIEDIRHRPRLAVMDAAAVKIAVEQSAVKHQLTLSTIAAQEPNGVRITLTSASFEKWLRWLRELQETQHIRIDSAAVTSLTEPGMVSIRATLTNGNNP